VERQEYFKIALAGFVNDFLPILDNFERALEHARPEDLESDFGQGIVIIRKQLHELWKRYGMIPIATSGMFDPNLHEAVATEETDEVPPNTILQEMQKGYFLNERLIRPSFVKVAVRKSDSDGAAGGGAPRRDSRG
jgi:molecular chaperone GrpE